LILEVVINPNRHQPGDLSSIFLLCPDGERSGLPEYFLIGDMFSASSLPNPGRFENPCSFDVLAN